MKLITRLLARPGGALGIAIIVFLSLLLITGFFFTPYPPNEMNIEDRLKPPSSAHLLGTDQYGRDILSRVTVGMRSSLGVGLATVLVGLLLGVLIGAAAASAGNPLEELLMRAMDVLYGFPPILIAILFTAILGPSVFNAILALALFNIPIFARLTRANFLSLKGRKFVEAARAMGQSDLSVTKRHILPNMTSPLIVQATIQFSLAILAEAAFSYLGLGIQPPTPSWGLMLKQAQIFIPLSPWPAIFPGLAIMLTVLGFNLLGDALQDVLNPQLVTFRG